MACTAPFAEAWSFASFWCTGATVSGVDNGGGVGVATLTDTTVDFARAGVEANTGMVLYNVTLGTSGPVTAVAVHALTATGVLWTNAQAYRIVTIDALERATIEHYLDIAASDVHAAMAQQGMCDCVLASWAAGFLEKLNIIDAAAYYQCTCGQPRMTDDMRKSYLAWADTQLVAIRTGNLDLCQGATGADYPAVGWAEQTLTDFAAAQVQVNYASRNP
jgi:hypothetical protein